MYFQPAVRECMQFEFATFFASHIDLFAIENANRKELAATGSVHVSCPLNT